MTEKIRRLNDRQQAREKLPIFFGSRDNYTHPIKEMIANAADELKNNATDKPIITVHLSNNNKRITVSDNGRGIPIDGETDGVKNYELLFLTLFAGTKYDITDRVSTGTNGVGNTAICYTSSYFSVQSFRNGEEHSITFVDGGKIEKELETKKSNSNAHGSTFTFELDKNIYTNTIFKVEEVREIVRHFSVAALGIEFKFASENEDGEYKSETFLYESTEDYFKEVIGSQSTSSIFGLGKVNVEEEVFIGSSELGPGTKEIEKNSYDILITTSPMPIQETYLNMTFLEEGGSILDGVLDGIRLWLNKYCREKKLFPNKVTAFNKDDVNSSVSLLAIAESNIVEFANQTKLSTNKKLYNRQVKDYVNSIMEAESIKNPKMFKKFVDHILEVQKFNGANNKAREKLKKKLTEKVEGIGNKVEKLIDCEKHGLEAELFLTEGDSANGSIIDSRDDEFQAAFPLRGKVLNVLKAPASRIFANKEIINMVKIIGTGISDGKKNDFNIDNVRYGKIILTTDADADGGHIASLLIAFIYRFMRPLIENSYVYVAQTPLYELKFKDDSTIYFLTEEDKNKNIGKYKDKKYTINRLKGLGEVDAETLYETTMNPETRNLIQLTSDDAKKMSDMVVDWMGESVDRRKEMIAEQLPNYVNDID